MENLDTLCDITHILFPLPVLTDSCNLEPCVGKASEEQLSQNEERCELLAMPSIAKEQRWGSDPLHFPSLSQITSISMAEAKVDV